MKSIHIFLTILLTGCVLNGHYGVKENEPKARITLGCPENVYGKASYYFVQMINGKNTSSKKSCVKNSFYVPAGRVALWLDLIGTIPTAGGNYNGYTELIFNVDDGESYTINHEESGRVFNILVYDNAGNLIHRESVTKKYVPKPKEYHFNIFI